MDTQRVGGCAIAHVAQVPDPTSERTSSGWGVIEMPFLPGWPSGRRAADIGNSHLPGDVSSLYGDVVLKVCAPLSSCATRPAFPTKRWALLRCDFLRREVHAFMGRHFPLGRGAALWRQVDISNIAPRYAPVSTPSIRSDIEYRTFQVRTPHVTRRASY